MGTLHPERRGAGVIEALLGATDIPESRWSARPWPVTTAWTNIGTLADGLQTPHWAGFHYQFSARVGTDMGRKIGRYVVETVMQPVWPTAALASPAAKIRSSGQAVQFRYWHEAGSVARLAIRQATAATARRLPLRRAN